MGGAEPISPELALVSPELSAEARRALPDRPWEAFAPPRPRPQPQPADLPRPTLRLAVLPAEPVPAAPPPVERPRRRVFTVSRVVTAALLALLAVTSFLPPRHAPRLVTADPIPVAPAAAATPPTPAFDIVLPAGEDCAPAGGQRDPFRPVCPPGRTR